MPSHRFPVRLKHAWAVLSGQISLSPAQIAERKLMVALAKTESSLAALSAAATSLVAASANAQANAAALADAQATIDSIDDSVSEKIDAITAQLTGAAAAQADAATVTA